MTDPIFLQSRYVLEQKSSCLDSYKQGFRELLYIYHYHRSYTESKQSLKNWMYGYPLYLSSEYDIYPPELRKANRSLTQFITISYSAIEHLSTQLVLKCLRNPSDKELVGKVVRQSSHTDQLFWASFTSNDLEAFKTVNRLNNNVRISILNQINSDLIDNCADKINTFSDTRHTVAHSWRANTHVHLFDDLINRSDVFAPIDTGYELVNMLAENVYGMNIQNIVEFIEESLDKRTESIFSDFKYKDVCELPIIQLINLFQEFNLQVERSPDPREEAVNMDLFLTIIRALVEKYEFNVEKAENINILPAIGQNQRIISPTDFHIKDTTIPKKVHRDELFSIKMSFGLEEVGTDAHRDDDFQWYAILLVDDMIVATDPANPFRNMNEVTTEDMIGEFSYKFDEKGSHDIEIAIIIKGTMSIQPLQTRSTVHTL